MPRLRNWEMQSVYWGQDMSEGTKIDEEMLLQRVEESLVEIRGKLASTKYYTLEDQYSEDWLE